MREALWSAGSLLPLWIERFSGDAPWQPNEGRSAEFMKLSATPALAGYKTNSLPVCFS